MRTTYSAKELVTAAKGDVGTLDPADVASARSQGAVLVDVREPGEWEQGHIAEAIHIPRGTLEFNIDDAIKDKDVRIVTYCAAGSRAALAAATLKQMGYAGAIASEAGFDDLAKQGLPVEKGDLTNND
ncbi:rhodanese-like domain-containing protein [Zhongshania sp.]|jgi:rhodanese-related sulfurtransferase|uniref:rhodanese-like domain-containing protein n=1 Tax=Zhongshania sp. TaxID=1971902 RepID=UPI000EE33BEC|nr:rhodanese-like domain-containing protein [Zhongshania sp.]MBQ0796263.1 sulfurtransferase [Zhongshania sp.]HCS29594.1 hypothetical protein [Spongiibacteraceae bacterium]|tara:strand:- start:1052 stop:1435 length:384 start_codon:yes stop_codon:yes gene_type:complete